MLSAVLTWADGNWSILDLFVHVHHVSAGGLRYVADFDLSGPYILSVHEWFGLRQALLDGWSLKMWRFVADI